MGLRCITDAPTLFAQAVNQSVDIVVILAAADNHRRNRDSRKKLAIASQVP